MKKLFLILFLVMETAVFSQTYKADLTVKVRAGSGSYGGGCRNHIYVYLHYNNGDKQLILPTVDLNNVSDTYYSTFQESVEFEGTKNGTKIYPTKIETITSRNWERTFGNCGGTGSFNNVSEIHNLNGRYCDINSTDIAKWWDVNSTLEIYPKALGVVDPFSNNIIGYDDPFQVSADPGSMNYDPSFYNWEYHIEGEMEATYIWGYVESPIDKDPAGFPIETNPEYVIVDTTYADKWRPLPDFQGQNSFTITPNSFLGTNAINKKIDFRVNTCLDYYSNLVTYELRNSAPKIIGTSTKRPTCFGESDGSARIYFNRALRFGEEISYVLYDSSKIVDETIPTYQPIYNEENLTTFVPETAGDYTGYYYISVSGLPQSTDYFFEIIGAGDTEFASLNPEESEYKNSPMLYTEGAAYETAIKIYPPVPVSFEIQDPPVPPGCNGGSDGSITLSASGGEGNYKYQLYESTEGLMHDWTPFSQPQTHTITGLSSGEYFIKVKDGNGCVSKVINKDGTGNIVSLGNEIEAPVSLGQPDPLSIEVVDHKDPDAFGFADGFIKIMIDGGTSLNGDYTVIWKDSQGNVINTVTSGIIGEQYYEKLENIGAGTYTATVYDDNFSSVGTTTNSQGCSIDISYSLTEPAVLAATLEETGVISCNTLNTGDPFKITDGEITAHASGGVKLGASQNGGLPYYYTWKKKNSAGQWEVVTNSLGQPVKDSILRNIGKGEYALNIKDSNDIILGEYQNNILVSPTDITYTIAEPAPLAITFQKEDVFCKGGNNAWIAAAVTGGTGDYTLSWSNGASTPKIENLFPGFYTLYVKDVNGCNTEKTIEITEPENTLTVSFDSYQQPTASGLTNGFIEALISGGTAYPDFSYDYSWKDMDGNDLGAQVSEVSSGAGGYKIKLTNIGKGTFYLSVKDANYNKTGINAGCAVIDSEFVMDDPEPMELIIEESMTISCNSLNEYGNPSADGNLTAHAVGGVLLAPDQNNGLPYYYTWKKKSASGQWEVLTGQQDSIAVNLNAGIYAVNIEDANGIVLGQYLNNTLDKAIDSTYFLQEPPLLELVTTQGNAYCYGGSDGWAEVQITGGVPPYAVTWSTGESSNRIIDLTTGTYTVKVTDVRGCEATKEVIITEPAEPIMITYPNYDRPTSIGASDAWIEANVTGGTAFDDNTYTYVWMDEAGNNLNSQTRTEVKNGSYSIRLENITAGDYYLNIKDKNFEFAVTKDGCTFTESSYTIFEPIEASVEMYVPISCNQANVFENTYSDGELIAYVEGGVPFKTGEPYIYHWKKQNENGIWEDLPGQEGNIADNLSEGFYALNVEDSKGSIIGIYQGANLLQAKDVTFYLEEPELLQISFETSEITCDSGSNGQITAYVTGGVPPYNFKWSNGAVTSKVENLIAGTYFVYVTDSRGCELTGSVTIDQPGELQIDVLQEIPPTCYGGSDGLIEVNTSGGVAPYQYQWNTGQQSPYLNSLSQGTYSLKITDSQGCIAYREVILEDPSPLEVDLGDDRTLCNSQVLELDISIDDPGASYFWEADNGFTSTAPVVSLNQPGTYTATLTSSKGCVGRDQLTIYESDSEISAHFLLSSQAFVGEEVVLVNVSEPMSEKVEWFVPDGVEVISESREALILKFDESGVFEVTLKSTEGDCYQEYSKPVIVENAAELVEIGDADTPFIIEFSVYPNPSTGDFSAKITLSEKSDVSLRLISMITALTASELSLKNSKEYLEEFDLLIPSGSYILLLETPKGSKVRKVIIK